MTGFADFNTFLSFSRELCKNQPESEDIQMDVVCFTLVSWSNKIPKKEEIYAHKGCDSGYLQNLDEFRILSHQVGWPQLSLNDSFGGKLQNTEFIWLAMSQLSSKMDRRTGGFTERRTSRWASDNTLFRKGHLK